MRFVAECVQDSLSIWEQCLNSPFLQKLENGTLEESGFLGYIIDDSLYLREYAKVFVWGMTKTQTMEDIQISYSLLSLDIFMFLRITKQYFASALSVSVV